MRLKLALAFLITTFLFIITNFIFTPPSDYSLWDLVGYVSSEILIGLVAAVVLSKYFTRHLRELASVSAVISHGDLTRKVDVRTTDEVGEVARSFNTSERRLWTDVILPSATPYVLAGVRLAIGRGLIGMIVAEFFIGLVGLGYLIISYENVFRIDRMFVPVIVVATMGILMMGFVQWLEGRIAPWLKREQ